MNNDEIQLLTERQVAKMLGKSTAWLQRARWAGDSIPYRKIGRNVRYLKSDVLDWFNSARTFTSTSQYNIESSTIGKNSSKKGDTNDDCQQKSRWR